MRITITDDDGIIIENTTISLKIETPALACKAHDAAIEALGVCVCDRCGRFTDDIAIDDISVLCRTCYDKDANSN